MNEYVLGKVLNTNLQQLHTKLLCCISDFVLLGIPVDVVGGDTVGAGIEENRHDFEINFKFDMKFD